MEFAGKDIPFAEAPSFSNSFQVYAELINVPSLSLKFVYDRKFNSPFMDFVRLNLDEINAVELYKNSGEKLFEGYLDTDDEIVIEDHTIKLEFLHKISAKLEEEIPDDTILGSSFYLLPDNLPGEKSFEEIINAFVNTFMPGFSVLYPNNWILYQPYYWIATTKLNNTFFYATMKGYRLKADLSNKTIQQCLKLFCMSTRSRVLIGQNSLQFISYNSEPTLVTADGELFEEGLSISKKNRIGFTFDAGISMIMKYEQNQNGYLFNYKPAEDGIQQWMEEYYEEFGEISYVEHKISGLNSNLACGSYWKRGDKALLASSFVRNANMIDKELQSVDITALEMINV